MKTLIKIILINAVLFVAALFLCLFIEFNFVYKPNGNDFIISWDVFGVFVFVHLIINLLFLTKVKQNSITTIVGSCIFILILYGLFASLYI